MAPSDNARQNNSPPNASPEDPHVDAEAQDGRASLIRMRSTSESAESPAATQWVGEVIDERYEIKRLLGEGGMGAVYVAEHLSLKNEVALKVIRPAFEDVAEFAMRFAREARVVAQISKPHVVTALDYGTLPDGGAYLVTKLVAGRTLRDYLAKGKPLPLPVAAHIGAQIADALAAAHAKGVIHRDLKPENIMLQRGDDASLFVTVLDFGLARTLKTDDVDGDEGPERGLAKALTKIGTVMGTPGYMAPEQAVGDDVDHRSDLYALGVLMWEMCTGRSLFHSDKPSKALAAQLTTEPPSILDEQVDAGDSAKLAPEMAQLVQQLLARDSSQRPDSASDVRDALRDFAARAGKLISPSLLPAGLPSIPALDGSEPTGDDIESAPTLLPQQVGSANAVTPTLHAERDVSGSGPQMSSAPTLPGVVGSGIQPAKTRWLFLGLGGAVLLLLGALVAAVGFLLFKQSQTVDVAPEAPMTEEARALMEKAQQDETIPNEVLLRIETLATGEDKTARSEAATWLQLHQPAPDVPPYALALADLEQAQTCRTMIDALDHIEKIKDYRALPVLFWYSNRPKSGCGAGKKKDCYGCIRDKVGTAIGTLRETRLEELTGDTGDAPSAEAAAPAEAAPAESAAEAAAAPPAGPAP